MWACPKCVEEVEDDFDVCWGCGTSRDGTEDPTFETADEAEAIFDPAEDQDCKPLAEGDDEIDESIPDLVECIRADNVTEARFVADQLRSNGIPAVSDRQDLNISVLGGWRPAAWNQGPRVRVRPQDLTRALSWVEDYRRRRKERANAPEDDSPDSPD